MLARLLLATLIAASPLGFLAAEPLSRAASPERTKQVKIEVKFISLAEDFFERIGVDFSAPNASGKVIREKVTDSPDAKEPIFLNDKQLRKFLESVEADVRTNIMEAPSVIVSDGKTAVVRCMEEIVGNNQRETVSAGYEVSVQPRIASDGRTIALHLKMALRSVDSEKPLRITTRTLDDELTIPAEHSVLVARWKQLSEGRCEYGPPVVSKIPYVGRLFKNVGYGRSTENVLVLVTASIVGDEAKKAAEAEPTDTKKEIARLMKQFNELYKDGKYAEAERCAARVDELEPGNPMAYAARAIARLHLAPHAPAK